MSVYDRREALRLAIKFHEGKVGWTDSVLTVADQFDAWIERGRDQTDIEDKDIEDYHQSMVDTHVEKMVHLAHERITAGTFTTAEAREFIEQNT